MKPEPPFFKFTRVFLMRGFTGNTTHNAVGKYYIRLNNINNKIIAVI